MRINDHYQVDNLANVAGCVEIIGYLDGFFDQSIKPKSTKTEGLVPLLKILGIVALRRSGMFNFDQYKPDTTFRVDPREPIEFWI